MCSVFLHFYRYFISTCSVARRRYVYIQYDRELILFVRLYTNVCSGSQPDSDYAAVDKACYAGSTNSIILRVPATIDAPSDAHM